MTALVLSERLKKALAFDAPYVIDRLIKDRVADTPALAGELFSEVKKFFVLCEITDDVSLPMYSAMVDQAWHTFILFTAEYTAYSHHYFGRYLNHVPAGGNVVDRRRVGTFSEFRERYEALHGTPMPRIWYDSNSISPARRVINAQAGQLTVNRMGRTVELVDSAGSVVLSTNGIARPALHFVAQTSDFYVRELPGNLTDDEKIGLAQALTQSRVLRVAP
ncbi:glycine-rich domain-containing protein [Mycobacterium angelicum]|uniref:Uncharacterized protein n=1 Tax=Mycobacterium angelicum TaxID=470074 RepID=A0A1W9ZMY2_MYCAN|nr:hypothetical protein [Mycobacterium angelicum]MCV7200101.1 hypothetical protein [Mycobacterium angelicum]ORA19130.1 hypothetical protein BST12_18060 [Mycobacterium angelicum]